METPVLVPAGTGQASYSDPHSPHQVGDLSGISVDPNDGSFWAVSEFANTEATANWGTAIANFTLGSTPLPADLAATQTDGKTTAVPGTSDTYTITVTNNGPSTVTSLTLTDTLPTALLTPTFGTPSSGSYNSTTGLWSGLGLATGQSATITLSGTIDPAATGSLTNTVTVAPPNGVTDANPGNNTASDTDTLTPQADLAVTTSDGKTSAVPGTSDTYTITVTNNGPSTVSSLTLTDTIPAALLNPTFGTPSAGSYNSTTGLWSGLSLATGSAWPPARVPPSR
jgi:uncharacterized repeat protein (TIGR01451 family)